MDHHISDTVRHALGADDSKPAKHISHIVHKKSHNGDHIFEHHHTHPEHHPSETHTKRGDDEMVEHMMQHAGTPNPGEAEADAGNPEAYIPPPASPNQGGSPADNSTSNGSAPVMAAAGA